MGAPRRREPPKPSAAPVNLRSTALPTQPFKPAQQQAQKRVVQAQRALPKQPTPHIPRIAHPTPTQTRAALQLVHHAQSQALGPSPTAAHIRAYQQELATDPRQRQYLATVQHYVKAAQGHEAELVGRIQAGGGHGIDSALTPAAMHLTRQEAEALGRRVLASGPRSSAKPAPPAKDVALPLLGVAHVTIPGSGNFVKGLSGALASVAPGLAGNTPETRFGRSLGKDALAIGELPFRGGYQVATAATQAAAGNLKPAKQLGQSIVTGLEHGAAGEALQGHFTKAEQQVREHPLFSALEVLGAGGVAGRAAGGLARTAGGANVEQAGLRGALARAGSPVRNPVGYTDEAGLARKGTVRQRTHSPDLIRSFGQHLADRRRQPIRDAQGKPVTIVDRGRTVTVLKPTKREQERFANKRGNYESSRTQSGEHMERERARKAANAAEASSGHLPTHAIRGAIGRELTHLVATGTIRGLATFKDDLEKRAKEVEAAVKDPTNFRTRADLKAAKRNAVILRRAADSPKIAKLAPQIVEQGLRYGTALKKGDLRQGDLSIHPHEELARSALHEYALAHMEAQHFTEADHAAAEQHALGLEHQAAVRVAEADPASPEHGAALRELTAARSHRIAVSGRGLPEHVVAHEAAFHAHAAARQHLKTATQELRRAERARARLVGVHASRRGSQGLRGATEKEKALSQASVDRVTAAKAAVMEAARARRLAGHELRRTPLPKATAAMRHKNGEILTDREIHEHAEAAGRDPNTIGYAPHVIGAGSKRAYHQPYRPGTRPTAGGGEAKSGSLYHSGATLFSTQLLRDELVRKGTLSHKAEALDKFAGEAGVRKPNGDYFTPKQAAEAASAFKAEGKGEWVPIRAFGARLSKETQAHLREVQSPALMESAHLALLRERIVTDGAKGTPNVVLVPKPLIDALEAQLQPASGLEKTFALLNAPFRMAVLPQPRWLTGNFVEPFFVRLPLSGSGVINIPGMALDIAAGRKVLRAMERSGDPAQVRAAREIRDHQFGGLFIGRRGASQRRTHEDLKGPEAEAMYGAHVVRNLAVAKQFGDLVLSLPHGFFHINRVIESATQRASFGRSVRKDIQAWTGQWHQTVLLGQKAIEDVGKGLVNTSTQQRFMEAQHELLGKYDGFGPRTRKLIQTVAPFLPWTLASMRFVFWTVPAHHTVAFVALMKAAQSVNSEWEAAHAGVPPGTLKDAAIRSDGGLTDFARYTPYGATIPPVQGDFANLTDVALPQVSGAVNALKGKDPFGKDLAVPKTPSNPEGKPSGGQKAGIAVNSLLEALVPLLAQGRRVQEGGGTAYGNSTILSPKTKPGTSHQSALNRTFNPFRPTYLKQPLLTGGGSPAPATPAERRAISRSDRQTARGAAALQRALERLERKR